MATMGSIMNSGVVQGQAQPDPVVASEELKQTSTSTEATEIRCQEKSKGGLCYEVILAEPSVQASVPKIPVTPAKIVSAEDIEEKLRAAEERRLQLEAKKIIEWNAKQAKIEEASRKKEELDKEFAAHTKEALEAKMEQYEEKREALITDMKEKLKVHAQEIEKTRQSLENKKDEERRAIEEKLKAAESMRDENIKKMLDRLKEHNTTKVSNVRSNVDTRVNEISNAQTRIIENKLSTAEMNREKEIQKKIDNIRKHERRAEIVRQNKAALANSDLNQEESMTASSVKIVKIPLNLNEFHLNIYIIKHYKKTFLLNIYHKYIKLNFIFIVVFIKLKKKSQNCCINVFLLKKKNLNENNYKNLKLK
uniref:CSON000781 protein n=1 Tax=Culicoides sonorensis TaxID=179676 RepID=A0A336KWK4_CULSO